MISKSIPFGLLAVALVLNAGQGADDMVPGCKSSEPLEQVVTSPFLRLVTLNVAHGRKDGANQMFQKTERIRGNLIDVAGFLGETQAHAVALQEADAPSAWSGKFDHVALIAHEAAYPCIHHGIHASNLMHDFGTALISRFPFQQTLTHSFEPSRPTLTKGFVAGSILWNPDNSLEEPVEVTLVSVHLDFSRSKIRRSQAGEMIEALGDVEGPMVLLGDFNTDWKDEESELHILADQLNLHAFRPMADGLATYGKKGARLDWILLSQELGFQDFAVFPDIVSDHLAVGAELVLAGPPRMSTGPL
jgi:endonuclease/exonuclease/phosphatase family metal-dependent hydrolase